MSGELIVLVRTNCSELTLHVCNVWTVDSLTLSSNCSELTLHACNFWIVDILVLTVLYSHYMYVMSGQLIVLVLTVLNSHYMYVMSG